MDSKNGRSCPTRTQFIHPRHVGDHSRPSLGIHDHQRLVPGYQALVTKNNNSVCIKESGWICHPRNVLFLSSSWLTTDSKGQSEQCSSWLLQVVLRAWQSIELLGFHKQHAQTLLLDGTGRNRILSLLEPAQLQRMSAGLAIHRRSTSSMMYPNTIIPWYGLGTPHRKPPIVNRTGKKTLLQFTRAGLILIKGYCDRQPPWLKQMRVRFICLLPSSYIRPALNPKETNDHYLNAVLQEILTSVHASIYLSAHYLTLAPRRHTSRVVQILLIGTCAYSLELGYIVDVDSPGSKYNTSDMCLAHLRVDDNSIKVPPFRLNGLCTDKVRKDIVTV
ncbi:hypothetical protein BCR41DRAFT_388381 [Lobosporangium transversale]|uniref:Uncharacterized protein n=1 Tax=Lobosporangium transversale TaxID=64571 RepID=A0A1Y2GH90_9FUNG|nr:hypothetical protein BCR41DRAFT_388381 [Lobosporangium transversale]ORZ09444.1 hypothetical protein BCR41DRAFT_388381 [Lobosporangium transversale]|eukprot:XP_021878897.1 hypothetical protein BCR41DRAFT_388381 [Lobosporangium transversale]